MKNFLPRTLFLSLVLFAVTLFDSSLVYSQTKVDFTYNGKNYSIVKSQKGWKDAASWAKTNEAYLVEINDKNEQDAVYGAIKQNISSTYTTVTDGGGVAYIWIGANDLSTEGTWIFDGNNDGSGTDFWKGQGKAGKNDGQAVNSRFYFWGGASTGVANEPDNFGEAYGYYQDAAAIALASWPYGVAGEWNDIDAANQLYYVVEYIVKVIDPTNVKATLDTKNVSVNLTWNDNSNFETGYTIERINGTSVVTFEVGANVTSYVDNTVINGVTYYYQVRGYNDEHKSGWTKSSDIDINITIKTPTNLTATLSSTEFAINLNWTDNSDNEFQFHLIRIKDKDTIKIYLPENSISYIDRNISNNSSYTYKLKAYKPKVNSDWSSSANVEVRETVNAPQNLTAIISIDKKFVTLTWEDRSDNETGFILRKFVDGKTEYITLPRNTFNYIDNDIDPSKVIVYDIQAQRYNVVMSSWSYKAIVGDNSSIKILANSKELIDCEGVEDASIVVAATTESGDLPFYQWYKDGIPLEGENSHILNFDSFDFTVSGIYTALVYTDMEIGAFKFSNSIPVYALTLPTIIQQPKAIIDAVVGENYTFDLKVHYRGLIPPYYKDSFQWYKFDAEKNDSIILQNDGRLSGVTSSIFTINSLVEADICKSGDFYFVKIVSQCGTVYSDPFVIAEQPQIVFRTQPENLNPCPKQNVVFIADAIAPKGLPIDYKWTKDGSYLSDNTKYNGVHTNKLQIFNVDVNDEGGYACEAIVNQVPTSKISDTGILELKDIPEAKAIGDATITTKRGNDVIMTVELIKGHEPITIQWYYNDELLQEGVWDKFDNAKLLNLILKDINENQAGDYKCVLSNDCDLTEVKFKLSVTKWDGSSIVDVIRKNGYALYTSYPNPVKGTATIRFEMPEANQALITLVDQSGRKISEIFNSIANKGLNEIKFTIDGSKLSDGVYFYTILTPGFNATLPIIIKQ